MQIPFGRPIGLFMINLKSKPMIKHETKKMRGKRSVGVWGMRGKTYITLVGLLPRMNPDMLLQRLHGRELFIAEITFAALDYIPPDRG